MARLKPRPFKALGLVKPRSFKKALGLANPLPPRYPIPMSRRKKLLAATFGVAVIVVALVGTAWMQARAVDRKARALRPGMTLPEVLTALDGWWMVNTHPVGRGTGRARLQPGPEFMGYTDPRADGPGQLYVLTPLAADGREADRRKLSAAEFTQRLDALLSSGEPWTAYFAYRTIPTQRGILLRFDGRGRVSALGNAAASP